MGWKPKRSDRRAEEERDALNNFYTFFSPKGANCVKKLATRILQSSTKKTAKNAEQKPLGRGLYIPTRKARGKTSGIKKLGICMQFSTVFVALNQWVQGSSP